MGLSCTCTEDYEWWYNVGDDTQPAEQDCKCHDCGAAIAAGAYSQRMETFAWDEDADEELQQDDFLMCEKCADTFHNLHALGFCLGLGKGEMAEAMLSYREMRGLPQR